MRNVREVWTQGSERVICPSPMWYHPVGNVVAVLSGTKYGGPQQRVDLRFCLSGEGLQLVLEEHLLLQLGRALDAGLESHVCGLDGEEGAHGELEQNHLHEFDGVEHFLRGARIHIDSFRCGSFTCQYSDAENAPHALPHTCCWSR